MRYLSLFSGIEAASVAWHPLGWECAGVSEIEPFPCAVLAHHYPDVPNLGDVTKITEEDIAALGRIDIVVFGSPCQDLSVAGLRKGFTCESTDTLTRSGLFFVAMRIVAWARKHCGCRFALWENVPGAFSSSQGRDFASVVGHMAGLEDVPVPAKGWGTEGVALGSNGLLEWATLDAQWFGVAQRRRRVFALLDTGDWAGRPPILLEPESLRGDSAPRREAGEGAAGTIAARFGISRNNHEECVAQQYLGNAEGGAGNVPFLTCHNTGGTAGISNQTPLVGVSTKLDTDCIGTLTAGFGKMGAPEIDAYTAIPWPASVAATLQARTKGGGGLGTDAECDGGLVPVVGAICRNSFSGGAGGRPEGAAAGHFVLVSYSIMPMNSGKDYKAREVDVAQPLMAGGPVGGNQGGDFILQLTPFDTTQITSPQNGSNPQPGDPCHPLAAGAHPPAIAFHPTQDPISSTDGSTHTPVVWPASVAATLNAAFGEKQGLEDQHINQGAPWFVPVTHSLRGEGFDDSEDGTGRGTPLVPVCFSSKDYGADAMNDLCPTLRAGGHADSHANAGVPPAIAFSIQAGAIKENPCIGPDGVGVRADNCAYTLEARSEVQAVAFAQNSRDEVRLMGGDGQIVGALSAEPGMKQTCYVAYGFEPGIAKREGSASRFIEEKSPTLRANMGDNQVASIAFHPTQDPISSADGSTHAMGCGSKGGCATVAVVMRESGQGYWMEDTIAGTLRAEGEDRPSRPSHVIGQPPAMQVRRLTPVECERLQGFPDNYTDIKPKGKPTPDGPRYKALGNSMAVPVMHWIGKKIQEAVE